MAIDISGADIIRSVFGLSKKQLECFLRLRDAKKTGTCITNLVGILGSERSLIQKQLKVLIESQLVEREKVSLLEFREKCVASQMSELMPKTNKGYLYIYSPISDEKLQETINQALQKWEATINEFMKEKPPEF